MQPIKKPMSHGVRVGWTITLGSLAAVLVAFGASALIIRSVHGRTKDAAGLLTLIIGMGCVGIAGLIGGPFIIMGKRREDQDIGEIHAGRNVLAHWTYAPDEWGRYIEHERARARKYFLMILLPVAALILITVLPSIFRSGSRAGSLGTLLAVLIPLGIIALVLWVIFYAPVVAAGKRAQGEVFVSPRGVLINDRYYSWMTFGGSSTLRVSHEAGDPPIIQFRWIVGAGRSAKYKRVRVPVPRNHEQEVQPLLAHFSS